MDEASKMTFDKAGHRNGRIVKLLIGSETVWSFHLGNQPAVVTHLLHGRTDRRPIVIAQKNICIHALLSTAAPVLVNVFHMHARDAWAVDFHPLLGETGVVDVADIQVKADPRAVDFVEERPELARRDEEALLGTTVLAANLHFGLGVERDPQRFRVPRGLRVDLPKVIEDGVGLRQFF